MFGRIFGEKETTCEDLVEKRKKQARDMEMFEKTAKIMEELSDNRLEFEKERISIRVSKRNDVHGNSKTIYTVEYRGDKVYQEKRIEQRPDWKYTVSEVNTFAPETEWLTKFNKLHQRAKDEEVRRKKKELKNKWNIDASDCKMCID